MRSIRRIRQLFWSAIFFLSIMAMTFLFMPVVVKAGEYNQMVVVLLGMIFWISAIIGYLMITVAEHERKWFINHRLDGNLKMNCRSGVTTFFANIPATVFDVMMIASFLVLIVIGFTELKNEYVSYVLLFFLVLSLNMHCLFNGRIYKLINLTLVRREKSYE